MKSCAITTRISLHPLPEVRAPSSAPDQEGRAYTSSWTSENRRAYHSRLAGDLTAAGESAVARNTTQLLGVGTRPVAGGRTWRRTRLQGRKLLRRHWGASWLRRRQVVGSRLARFAEAREIRCAGGCLRSPTWPRSSRPTASSG